MQADNLLLKKLTELQLQTVISYFICSALKIHNTEKV